MSFTQVTLGLINQVQPPVLPVSKVKTEAPMEIKKEPPESDIVEIGVDNITSSLEEETIPGLKDIDIVLHPLCEGLIKSETVPEDQLETKYLESVETQVYVKTENSSFLKRENKTEDSSDGNGSWGTGQGMVEFQGHHNGTAAPMTCPKGSSPNGISTQVLMKTEDTSDENVIRGAGQEMIEVQGSNEYSNTLSNLDTHKQLVFNSSKDLNSIGTTIRKAKHAKKIDFARFYKTDGITSWEKEKDKIKIIRACDIPVESHEYTSLAEHEHVCNHCQYACNRLNNLKRHIKQMHREVTTIYQCPYCSYKSKYSVKEHIILKHKDTKDIQWFQCNLCELKFKLKSSLTQHMKIHLKHKQMQDGLDLREKRCNKCNYRTDKNSVLKRHKLVHLKPEKMKYFYCYHCSYKSKQKSNLKIHIFRQHFKNVKEGKRHHCDKCDYKTYTSVHLKRHKLTHLKPEQIQYFYCYHCSYKAKQKGHLKGHIFIHFEKEQVKFDCYICNFMTPKRESIIKHIKKHSKLQNKSEINEGR